MNIPTIQSLHDLAMYFVDSADIERRAGKDPSSLLSIALNLERAAAIWHDVSDASEPTRSVLYRSAATLALRLNDLAEAHRLAKTGLTDRTPSEIKQELEVLVKYDFLRFNEHNQ